jgi:predicted phage tail protein
LSDLSVELTLFDDGVAVEVGDVIEVTHPIGLSAKKMRVLDVANDYGRFRVSASEYDPAVYSDAVATDPSYPDTNFTSPASPPTLTGLTAVEELYQLENGNYSSRIRAAWSAPTTYPYPYQTEVEVWGGGVLLGGGLTRQVEWASPSVQELVTYQVRIRIAGSTGAVGTWAYASVTAVGKFAPPGNVPLLSGFEAGGRVYLSWQPAVDIDIWRYEVRYGSTGGTWETAKMVDRVDALTLVSDQVPVGTWKFHVKALDSVGQYSATAATVNVTVTSDASAFLIDTYDQTAPTPTNY